jgi:hypothetical protein
LSTTAIFNRDDDVFEESVTGLNEEAKFVFAQQISKSPGYGGLSAQGASTHNLNDAVASINMCPSHPSPRP